MNQENIMKPSSFIFTSDEIIFKKRFEAFQDIRHPNPLTFSEYIKFINCKDISTVEHINYAITCFKLSKTMIEKMQSQILPIDDFFLQMQSSELASLVMVCIVNITFAETFLGHVRNSTTNQMRLSLDFSAHRQFCCFQDVVT